MILPRRGFTLIELLVVIGILLIVGGLGVSNFAEAVLRAKVARIKAEFATLSGAIEVYTVDNRKAPRMRHADFFGDPSLDTLDGLPVNGTVSAVLSTPVAYLARSTFVDPFMVGNMQAPLDEQYYTYQTLDEYVARRPASAFWKLAREWYGPWRLVSAGPDRYFDHNFLNSAQLVYDPTNGTVSAGNIFRSQRGMDTTLPPIPAMLGRH